MESASSMIYVYRATRRMPRHRRRQSSWTTHDQERYHTRIRTNDLQRRVVASRTRPARSTDMRTDTGQQVFAITMPRRERQYSMARPSKAAGDVIQRSSRALGSRRIAVWWAEQGHRESVGPSVKQYLSRGDRAGRKPAFERFGWVVTKARASIRAAFRRANVFSTPKPTRLIERMLQIGTLTPDNDIVLDFFAGSGTTGHAVYGCERQGRWKQAIHPCSTS